jgi:hypothetical protein
MPTEKADVYRAEGKGISAPEVRASSLFLQAADV